MPVLPHARRALGAALAAASATVLTLAAALAFAAPASAHTALTGSNPEEGATVAPPSEIVLEFASEVKLPQVVVTDESDARHELGEPETAGNDVTQALKAPLPNGGYTVGWRAVSPDGHPISGTFEFTVEGATSAAPSSPAQSSAGAPPAPAASQAGSPAAAAEPASESEGTSAGWLWIGLGALVVVLAAGGAVWFRRSKGAGAQS
ncbi:copper resistance CopC family protein [Actinomadura sp. WMMB 499]|uniref:copper resistance CopC family protein n=1 Tax=Actinomadura sp. WMMB 499 TaxID=1219491 RepID=UPI001248D83F|nr:copper resistance CopC family protein [Actinomadura sp. WMMB 499]QFG22693.1 copper resistance protein CopC [Actinomadura sp. WMMB 499]